MPRFPMNFAPLSRFVEVSFLVEQPDIHNEALPSPVKPSGSDNIPRLRHSFDL
jgi:hypothetical protein